MGDYWYKTLDKMEKIGKAISEDSVTKVKEAFLEHLIGSNNPSNLFDIKNDRESYYNTFNSLFPKSYNLNKEEVAYLLSEKSLTHISISRIEGDEIIFYHKSKIKPEPIQIDAYLINNMISEDVRKKKPEVFKIINEIIEEYNKLLKNTPNPCI